MQNMEKLANSLNINKKNSSAVLYNRLKLEEMLETEYRSLKSCGVLFFDLNDLKKLDEECKIETLDSVICALVESVYLVEYEGLTAYRYSKSKLLVIASNYSKDKMRHLIKLWEQNWNDLCNKNKIQYSIAVGISWDNAPVSVGELIAKANADMYRNKELMMAGIPMDYYIYGEIPCTYGLHSRKQFFDMIDYKLKKKVGQYNLIAIDIEHFKLFNKWYGRNKGDKFLEEFAVVLKNYEECYNGIAAYFGGDDFAILLPNEMKIFKQLEKELMDISFKYGNTAGFLPGFGIYCIEEDAPMAIEIYDYAVEALTYVEGDFERRFCYYSKAMTKKTEEELYILTEAKDALEEGQYTIYLQPKCQIKTKKIIGAEALVRWIHPTKGLIPPGMFIPILEKNGFISGVDKYVWELVCKQIKEWGDLGIEPIPVSINISRIDILCMDVVDTINQLVKKYNIDRKYIKIEITESAYVENGNKVFETIHNLREAGFTLLMDDFGSGYSSLNMLKQIMVDVIKIDMRFLQIDKQDTKKGLSILKSVINMSNEIEVPLIVEGVETEEQVEILQDMGVQFAQGYFFYRPMPVNEFTKLISNKENIARGYSLNQEIDTHHLNEVLQKMLSKRQERYKQVAIKKTKGGFISYKASGKQELLIVSQSIISMYDCETEEEFREYVNNSFIGMVHPEDFHRIDSEINEQIPDTEWKMDYIEYRIITKKGRIRYINDFGHLEEKPDTGENYFYVFLLDVTDRLREEELSE